MELDRIIRSWQEGSFPFLRTNSFPMNLKWRAGSCIWDVVRLSWSLEDGDHPMKNSTLSDPPLSFPELDGNASLAEASRELTLPVTFPGWLSSPFRSSDT